MARSGNCQPWPVTSAWSIRPTGDRWNATALGATGHRSRSPQDLRQPWRDIRMTSKRRDEGALRLSTSFPQVLHTGVRWRGGADDRQRSAQGRRFARMIVFRVAATDETPLPTPLSIATMRAMHASASILPMPCAAGRIDAVVTFSRPELRAILEVYGRMVMQGEWRDYAVSFGSDAACFAVYRCASASPAFRIEKRPAKTPGQGAFAVVAADGRTFRRGNQLESVLRAFESRRAREPARVLQFPTPVAR